MIRWLINRQIDSAERRLGAPLDYMRHMARVSRRSLIKFARFIPIAGHRHALPPGPCNAARLVASLSEDCGTCVQIAANVAKQEGLPPKSIRLILDRRYDELPDELAEMCRFAEAVIHRTGDEAELRERLRARFGEEALVELALAIATSRVFPTVKRAMGYAVACQRDGIRV